MREEDLPAHFKNILEDLKNYSGTIENDITDEMNSASSVEDFKIRVFKVIDDLIKEAEYIKKMIVGDKEEVLSTDETLNIDDARQIAFETLRVVATLPGWESFKDLVGRELDITDEIMDQAVGILFSDNEIGSKKIECEINISEEVNLRRLVDRYYVLEEEIDMMLAKLRNYGKECDCDNRVIFKEIKEIFEGDFDEISSTCLNCGGIVESEYI
jgi:hypothetical protein